MQGFFMKYIAFFLQILIFGCITSAKTDESGSEESGGSGRPRFYQGLYISNTVARQPKRLTNILEEMQELGMNAAVVDVQPHRLPDNFLDALNTHKVYGIARVVAFEGGLTSQFPSKDRMNSIKSAVRHACSLGFSEINLDYIRYSDGGWDFRASFEKRYENITGIISEIRRDTLDVCSPKVKWGGDVFGRVPFIENDAIGQRIENFSEVLDLIYPMLYPSHFYGLRDRIADPYTTVLEGMQKTMARSKPGTEAVGWIQGFQMHIGPSGLKYKDYIKVQMQACWDAKSRGFIVWNAGNDYAPTFAAFADFKKENSLR